MRRGIQFAERFIISERRSGGADSQLVGEADFVALAGGDVGAAAIDEAKIFVALGCQFEFHRSRWLKSPADNL